MPEINLADKDKINKIAKLLASSKRILFVTGAGISADSGLPTYRGVGGLYNHKKTEDGVPIEEALSAEFIRNHPYISWKHIANIERKCRGAKYNKAHKVIADLEHSGKEIWVLTQNVDGFHQQAGSTNVLDIHGDIHHLICSQCSWKERVVDYSNINQLPPLCPKCGGYIRPDVVFFGELLSAKKLQTLAKQLKNGFDLYFSVGTMATFAYIYQPLLYAKQHHSPLIEINPSSTIASAIADIKIRHEAAVSLDLIWQEFNNCKK
jgi:NAD-dependent deacetylase